MRSSASGIRFQPAAAAITGAAQSAGVGRKGAWPPMYSGRRILESGARGREFEIGPQLKVTDNFLQLQGQCGEILAGLGRLLGSIGGL
ncbi:MAG TPA: hypothetical protein VGF06_04570, partial [Terriglobales bacterium]